MRVERRIFDRCGLDELRVSCSSETGALRLEGTRFTALVMRLSEVDGESIDLRAAVDGRQVRA